MGVAVCVVGGVEIMCGVCLGHSHRCDCELRIMTIHNSSNICISGCGCGSGCGSGHGSGCVLCRCGASVHTHSISPK